VALHSAGQLIDDPNEGDTTGATVGADIDAVGAIASQGVCAGASAGAACDDNNFCNGPDSCDGFGSCSQHSGSACDDYNPCTVDSCAEETGCSNIVNVETTACGSCADGEDNDNDGQVDCRDEGCSTMAAVYDHATVALRPGGGSNFSSGGNVLVGGAANSAHSCARSAKIKGGTALRSLAVDGKLSFGEGETGERVISICDELALCPDTRISFKTDPPLVGPGRCSNDDLVECCVDADCGGSSCGGRMALNDPNNPYVTRNCASPIMQQCLGLASALTEADECLASLPCTQVSALTVVPVDAAARDNLKTNSATHSISIEVGSGLQVICANQLKLGPDGVGYDSELIIHGQPDTVLVFRLNKLALGAGSEVVLQGGLQAEKTLWYLPKKGAKLTRNAVLPGTIVALEGLISIGGESRVDGAVIGDKLKMLRSSMIDHRPFCADVCAP